MALDVDPSELSRAERRLLNQQNALLNKGSEEIIRAFEQEQLLKAIIAQENLTNRLIWDSEHNRLYEIYRDAKKDGDPDWQELKAKYVPLIQFRL